VGQASLRGCGHTLEARPLLDFRPDDIDGGPSDFTTTPKTCHLHHFLEEETEDLLPASAFLPHPLSPSLTSSFTNMRTCISQ
jgi:hypothetical protein